MSIIEQNKTTLRRYVDAFNQQQALVWNRARACLLDSNELPILNKMTVTLPSDSPAS